MTILRESSHHGGWVWFGIDILMICRDIFTEMFPKNSCSWIMTLFFPWDIRKKREAMPYPSKKPWRLSDLDWFGLIGLTSVLFILTHWRMTCLIMLVTPPGKWACLPGKSPSLKKEIHLQMVGFSIFMLGFGGKNHLKKKHYDATPNSSIPYFKRGCIIL